MKNSLAVLGAGHLGQQIAHYALSDGHYRDVIFFDDFTNETSVRGCRVAGKISTTIAGYANKEFDELIIGIGYKHLQVRKELFEQFADKLPFGKFIHSSCWVDETALIKEGVVVYPGCYIDARSVIDCNTLLNLNCTIAHDTIVGKHCFLSPRAAVAGFVNVGDQCVLGINCTIIDNITIAAKTQIGGGSVVIKPIATSGLYAGNPSKFIR